MKFTNGKIIALLIGIYILGVSCHSNNCEKTFQGGIENTMVFPTNIKKEGNDCLISIIGINLTTLYISDPINRHIGYLNSDDIVVEIPGAEYQINPSWGEEAARGDATDESEDLLILHIPKPVDGLYLLEIHGKSNELAGGISVTARCGEEIETMQDILLSKNTELPAIYRFTFSSRSQEMMSDWEKVPSNNPN